MARCEILTRKEWRTLPRFQPQCLFDPQFGLRGHSADNSGGIIQAAEYVRMSTDAAIQRFADAHGITIVRFFVDAGISGVGIQGRDALQDLLRIVESKQVDFSTILVYDVSRWGRFQEPDEGAYYEFRCIRANITVQYCAEQFPTDNAPMGAVMKSSTRRHGRLRLATTTPRPARPAKSNPCARRTQKLPNGPRHPHARRPEIEVATVRRIYHLFT